MFLWTLTGVGEPCTVKCTTFFKLISFLLTFDVMFAESTYALHDYMMMILRYIIIAFALVGLAPPWYSNLHNQSCSLPVS